MVARRRQELLLDTDKPRITLHVDLGCVDGWNAQLPGSETRKMYTFNS